MDVRDATDADADAIADIGGMPRDAADRLVRERTVRVATADDGVVGFVAYDAWRGTVHVTRLGGEGGALERLLDEPRRLAANDGVPIEVVVPESDAPTREAVEDVGFDDRGPGPMFRGERTRRYRTEP